MHTCLVGSRRPLLFFGAERLHVIAVGAHLFSRMRGDTAVLLMEVNIYYSSVIITQSWECTQSQSCATLTRADGAGWQNTRNLLLGSWILELLCFPLLLLADYKLCPPHIAVFCIDCGIADVSLPIYHDVQGL